MGLKCVQVGASEVNKTPICRGKKNDTMTNFN